MYILSPPRVLSKKRELTDDSCIDILWRPPKGYFFKRIGVSRPAETLKVSPVRLQKYEINMNWENNQNNSSLVFLRLFGGFVKNDCLRSQSV